MIEYGPRTSGIEADNSDLSDDESTFNDNFSVATKDLNRRALNMSDSELESNTPEILRPVLTSCFKSDLNFWGFNHVCS